MKSVSAMFIVSVLLLISSSLNKKLRKSEHEPTIKEVEDRAVKILSEYGRLVSDVVDHLVHTLHEHEVRDHTVKEVVEYLHQIDSSDTKLSKKDIFEIAAAYGAREDDVMSLNQLKQIFAECYLRVFLREAKRHHDDEHSS
jgi:hypothetical protein